MLACPSGLPHFHGRSMTCAQVARLCSSTNCYVRIWIRRNCAHYLPCYADFLRRLPPTGEQLCIRHWVRLERGLADFRCMPISSFRKFCSTYLTRCPPMIVVHRRFYPSQPCVSCCRA